MNQTLRLHTFETNSSSTHNMIIIPDEEYAKWENNELFYIMYDWGKSAELIKKNNGRRLYNKQELEDAGLFDDMPKPEDYNKEYQYEDDYNDWLRDNDFITCEQWDDRELEADHTEYTTKNGDKIHILCEYGYDG